MAIPDFENQNFPGGACPRTPLAYASLRAWLVKFPQLRHWLEYNAESNNYLQVISHFLYNFSSLLVAYPQLPTWHIKETLNIEKITITFNEMQQKIE
jgi:hypothetical protein